MNRILLICISSLLIYFPFGQARGQIKRNHEVKGQIVDGSGQGIPFATVMILQARDSSLIKGTATGKEGQFSIPGLPPGKYLLKASELGYSTKYSPVFLWKGDSAGASIILVLEDNTRTLRGVNITSQKPFVEYQADKTIVNVENSIVSAGSNALEILKKSPGVSVDNNDQISLNGKAGVLIMIDGRQTYLSQQQVVNMLKTMNASSIARIELMTQPSAKYDAAGNAGIINIITRKNKMRGWNGSITAGYGQGIYNRENGGANLNYRSGKFNVYGNYDFSRQVWYNQLDLIRDFNDGPSGSLSAKFIQTSINRNPSENHDLKAGVDYFLNKQNTIGVMVNAVINPEEVNTNSNTLIENPDGSLQSQALTHNQSQDRWSNITYDLNYQGKLDTSGTELDADMAYSRFNNLNQQQFLTNTFDSLGNMEKLAGMLNPEIRKGTLPSLISIHTAKIDFTHPLGRQAKLEAGLKTSFVTSDNNVQYFYQDNGAWLFDSATNHFKYTENINAAYINFSKTFSKGYSLQIGLRGEQTISRGQQFTIDSTVSRNYIQLFPTIYLSRKLNKDNTVGFSYARRIDRPDYQDLNPFRYYLDPYTYEVGNPFLQPQLTNSIELTHSYQGILNTTLNYSRTRNVISNVLNQVDSSKITYQTKDNLASLTHVGLAISANLGITRWWMTNDYLNIFDNLYQGIYLGTPFQDGMLSWMFNSTNTFTLPKGYSLELSGYYQSAAVEGLLTGEPRYEISGGMEKSILNKRGIIKLNVNDIFDTQHFTGNMNYQNIHVFVNNHWDSRMVNLSFTYHFSKGKINQVQRHRSSIDAEQSRIKH